MLIVSDSDCIARFGMRAVRSGEEGFPSPLGTLAGVSEFIITRSVPAIRSATRVPQSISNSESHNGWCAFASPSTHEVVFVARRMG